MSQASSSKKRSSEETDDSDCPSNDEDEVQFEFEGRAIEGSDFHGIKQLLKQIFLKSSVDTTELTEIIVSEGDVGSTIKVCADEGTEDDGSVLGIATVVSLTHLKSKCLCEVKDLFLKECKAHSQSQHTLLSEVLDGKKGHVGFLINERFLNIPADIAAPLLKTLLKEVKQASAKGKQYDFQYYAVIARTHQSPLPKKKRKKASTAASPPLVFEFTEYEALEQGSLLTFSYPVLEASGSVFGGNWRFGDQVLEPFRTVMILHEKELEKAISHL